MGTQNGGTLEYLVCVEPEQSAFERRRFLHQPARSIVARDGDQLHLRHLPNRIRNEREKDHGDSPGSVAGREPSPEWSGALGQDGEFHPGRTRDDCSANVRVCVRTTQRSFRWRHGGLGAALLPGRTCRGSQSENRVGHRAQIWRTSFPHRGTEITARLRFRRQTQLPF